MRNLNNCVYYLHERIGLDSDFLNSIVWDSQLTGVPIIYMLAADMHGLIRFWTMVGALRTVMVQMVERK